MPLVITRKIAGIGNGTSVAINYAGLSEADVNPKSFDLIEFPDRSIQVAGTFNGGSVVIEGSNNGIDWQTLTDPQGNALIFSAPRIEKIQELTAYTRPIVNSGTGVSVNAAFLVTRAAGEMEAGLIEGDSNALQSTVSALTSDVSGHNVEIASINTELDARGVQVDQNIADIEVLQVAQADDSLNINNLQTGLTASQGNITTLQTGLSTAQTNITNLQSGLTTAQSNISTLQTSVGSLTTQTSALTTDGAQNTSDIAALQNSIANLDESDVAETVTFKKFTATLKSQLEGLLSALAVGIPVQAGKITYPLGNVITEVLGVSNASGVEGSLLVHMVTLSRPAIVGDLFSFDLQNSTTGVGDYTTPPEFSSGVTLNTGVLTIPVGVDTFTISVQTINDISPELTETYTITVGGVSGTGTITDDDVEAPPNALQALTHVEVVEAPYGVLNSGQRTSAETSGGFTMFAVGRSQAEAITYNIYASTDDVTYTQVLTAQSFAPHADLIGTINYAHPTLAYVNPNDVPTTVTAGTLGLMVDTSGQSEFLSIGNRATYTELGDTVNVLEGIEEAVFDSIPIQVDSEETARIYLLGNVVIDPTIRANGTTVYYKVAPVDAQGAQLALNLIDPVSITIQSIASAPYKPHNVGFAHNLGNAVDLLPSDFVQYPTVPYSQRYNLHVRMGRSSRTDATVRGWFNEAPTSEAGVAYKMDIYGAADTVIRTKTADANGLLTYTFNEQGSDGFLSITKYSVYTELAGRRSRENVIYIGAAVRDSGDVTAISGVQDGANVVFTVTVQSRTAPYGVDFALAGNAFTDGGTGTPTLSTGASFLEQNAIQVDPSTTSFTVTVPITDATGKTLTLQLGRLTNSSGTVSASVTIAGDVTVASVSSPTVFEGSTLVYSVSLSGITSTSQNFSFTVGGTATSGADFNATASFDNGVTRTGDEITVPSGVSSFTVSVPTIDDATTEVAETVTVNVGGVTGTGTINDNDSGFVAIFNALAVSMSNATNEAVGPAGNTEITFTYPAQYTDIYFDIHPPTAATTMPVLLPEIPVDGIIRIELLIRTDTSGLAPIPFLFTSAQNGFSKVGLTALGNTVSASINVSATEYNTTRAVIRYQNTRGTAIPVSERLSFYIRQNGTTVPLNAGIKDVSIELE